MPMETRVESAPPAEILSLRALRNLTLAALVLGVAWRLIRYFLRFPVWGDEAMLCLNLLERGFGALARELGHNQVAPFLYLCSEKISVQLLGTSELAIRLLPLLVGISSLALCGQLARRTLSPLAATLAVAILAVAIWPVSMCTQAKPYAFDLFWSLVLLLPAAAWLRQPDRPGWLMLLTAMVAPALLFSYPAVFVAGGVSLAIFTTLCKRPTRPSIAWFVAFNVVMLAAFLGNYLVVIGNHVNAAGEAANTTGGHMQTYWRDSFPPRSIGPLLYWLLLSHIGELFSCPIGADRGGSILTVVLFCVGIRTLWKNHDRSLLVLLLAPFALNLLAAFGRFYPYSVARLSQHLVPSVVLLMAAGAATLVNALPRHRERCLVAAFGVLAAIGIGGIIRDIARPGRDPGVLWMRKQTVGQLDQIGNQTVVVLHDRELEPVLYWYLGTRPGGFLWGDQVDWDHLDPAIRRLWTLHYKFNDRYPVLGVPSSQWVTEETHSSSRSYDASATFFPNHDDSYVQELRWTLWKRVALESQAAAGE